MTFNSDLISLITIELAVLAILAALTRTRALLTVLDRKSSIRWLTAERKRLERFHQNPSRLTHFLLTQLACVALVASLGWIFSAVGHVEGALGWTSLINVVLSFIAYGLLVHTVAVSYRFNQGKDYLAKLDLRIGALRAKLVWAS